MKINKAVVCGDWHGHGKYIQDFLREMSKKGVEEVIHVGDVGFMGNINSYIQFLDDLLEQYGMKLYFIEGNHENYTWLNNLKRDESGLGIVSEYIKHIPRGYRTTYKGKEIVFVGGGVSVDQYSRIENFDWWEEEELTMQEVEEISKQEPADILISHDCPSRFTLDLPLSDYFPSDLIKKSNEHRKTLGIIDKALKIKQVVCGHYHISHEEEGVLVLDCNRWYVQDTQYRLLDDIIKKVK